MRDCVSWGGGASSGTGRGRRVVWSVKKAERGGRKAARQSCGARWVTRRKKTKRVRAEWGVGRDCVRLVRESGGVDVLDRLRVGSSVGPGGLKLS